MRTPWPRDVSVPEGLSLADNDGLLLLSSQESLITTAKRSLPLGTRILKALFCGCASFESSRSYASAAIELLRDTQSVCIVHNRDQMHTLIRMFPNARVLALPHDLRMHALDKPSGSCLTPLVERSQLRELSGGIYTNCNGCIFLGGDVIQAIMGTCPKIRRIDSPGVLPFFMGTYGLLTATKRARAENFNHLMICSLLFMSAEGTLHVPLVDDINFAADHFPFVETLQVAVGSLMSFCKLAGFRHLRSLDVTFHQRIAFADVDRSLGWVLTRCQGLEELGLLRCSGVRLCTIAKFSPKLKNLRLVACMGSPEDVPVDAQAFPKPASLLTAPTELLEEFGDPRVLLLAEDHIVLRLRTRWPRDLTLPEGLTLAGNDGLLLVSSQESLITAAKRTLPTGTRISKALFCSCASFESSSSYARAAMELLRHTQSVCIVHNRDQVHTLIRMFPNARVLALPHDLRIHSLDQPGTNCLVPLVKRSELREVLGGNCNGCLFMEGDLIQAIVRTCPKIRRIDCPGVLPCFMWMNDLVTSTKRARAESFKHLLLYSLSCMSAERILDAPLVDDIALAADHFPLVETLQVVVGSLVSFCNVAGFRHLRSLDVTFHQRVAFADVDSSLAWVLTRCPGLEELGLLRCSGVRLCTIAETLIGCRFRASKTSHWPRKESLSTLKVGARDLPDFARALPALRHLETDIFELRLFVENCYVPRGRVTLSWCGCIYCDVHRPDVEKSEDRSAHP
ncbi:hypothetical protein MTO96_023107 [Rhipicephalus appendiculatus]